MIDIIKSQKGRQVLWMEIGSSFRGKGNSGKLKRTGLFHRVNPRERG